LYAGYVTLLDNVGFAIGPILGSILLESLSYTYTYLISSGMVLILGLIPAMIVPQSGIDSCVKNEDVCGSNNFTYFKIL